MKEKNIISASDDIARQLKVLDKERENIRRKLAVIASKLATTAKEKESVRKKLVVTAKEKESVRKKLVVTASKLATTAKEKESVRKKLVVTDKELSLKAKQLAVITASLAEAKSQDEAILSSIGDGIIATDSDRRIIVMNKIAEKLLGWKIDEAIGKFYDDVVLLEDEKGTFIPPKEKPLHKAFDKLTTTTATAATTMGLYLISKNKIKFPVAITVSPVIISNKAIGAVEVFRDITREKELDKTKDEFISLASHQLKSPITAISWSSEALLGGKIGVLNEDQKRGLEIINVSSRNMAELVSGFLDITKMESSGFAVEKGDVDLLQISDSILAELVNQISVKKINIVKKYGNNIPHLNIGIKTARIILQNLLTNAVKYTPESGTVEVKIEKTAEGISISIKDNGYGIPEEAKRKIFTKLFRADNIREKEPSGTGLGLYLLKSMVDRIGGKVWFESKEGSGSTFYVNLK